MIYAITKYYGYFIALGNPDIIIVDSLYGPFLEVDLGAKRDFERLFFFTSRLNPEDE